jgi:hypothetical protein
MIARAKHTEASDPLVIADKGGVRVHVLKVVWDVYSAGQLDRLEIHQSRRAEPANAGSTTEPE